MVPTFISTIIHDAISYEICGKDARPSNNTTDLHFVGKDILWASCSAVELVKDNSKNSFSLNGLSKCGLS